MKLLDSPSVAFDSRYVLFQCLQHLPHLAIDLLFCSSILTTFSHTYRFVGDRPLAEAQEHLEDVDKTFDGIFHGTRFPFVVDILVFKLFSLQRVPNLLV